jgi:hypothetical protein
LKYYTFREGKQQKIPSLKLKIEVQLKIELPSLNVMQTGGNTSNSNHREVHIAFNSGRLRGS